MKDLDNSLFNIKIDSKGPYRGAILVAEPFLTDEYFNHAVISLVDYTPGENAMGIVLNRTSGYTLGQIIEGFDDDVDIPIFLGGPLSRNRLFYIHCLGNIFSGAVEIQPGLWIGGDYNQVLQYIRDGYPTDGLIRFFIGYSGWDKWQLEDEINNYVWAVAPPLSSNEILSGCDDSYWHKVVKQMGPKYRGWQMHPMFPTAN